MAKGSQKALPVPSKGRDITREEKIEIAAAVCDLYATDQYNLLDCLREFGIKSFNTWYAWADQIEEIAVLYNKAQELKGRIYRHSLLERSRTALERAIDGYTVSLQDQAEEVTPGDNDGPGKLVVKYRRTREIYVRPEIQAVLAVVYNLDGRHFAKNPEPYKAPPPETSSGIKIEIIGGDVPPVTDEEQIIDPYGDKSD